MVVVLKIGGSILGSAERSWVSELEALLAEGHRVIVVHGGGNRISRQLEQLGEPVEFIAGQRVTSPVALDTVVSVLCGVVNTELVAGLNERHIRAVGLSGVDGAMVVGHPSRLELGRVGTIDQVRPELLEVLLAKRMVPVLAPIIADRSGGFLNANGDFVAAAVAAALTADLLVFFTDSGGVRAEAANPDSMVARLKSDIARQWLKQGTATAGMIPKLEAGLMALAGGVARVRVGSCLNDRGTELVL